MLQLHHSMTACGLPDPDGQIALLKRTGLDRLLVETYNEKRLTTAATGRYLGNAKAALRAGKFDSDTLKMGIVAFDATMQRLAQVTEPSELSYALRANPARDMLIGFSQSLHR
jgi:hypothetical protein